MEAPAQAVARADFRISSILPSPLPRFACSLLLLPLPTLLSQHLLLVRHYNPDYNDCNSLNFIGSELGLSKRYPGDDD